VQDATFGDGIEHVATTAKGLTWVGYFDQGVCGSLGWGKPGPTPIGRYGINCFNSDLQLIAHASGDTFACYAMNIVGEAVYAYCWPDWSIRHLDPGGKQTTWTNVVSGARHLVVSGNAVALAGGYNEHDRVVVGRLEDGDFRVLKTGSLKLGGERLPSAVMLATRGHELHALFDQGWYRCELKNRGRSRHFRGLSPMSAR